MRLTLNFLFLFPGCVLAQYECSAPIACNKRINTQELTAAAQAIAPGIKLQRYDCVGEQTASIVFDGLETGPDCALFVDLVAVHDPIESDEEYRMRVAKEIKESAFKESDAYKELYDKIKAVEDKQKANHP